MSSPPASGACLACGSGRLQAGRTGTVRVHSGELAWYTTGEHGWYITSEHAWYILGEHRWYILGEHGWYIYVRLLTPIGDDLILRVNAKTGKFSQMDTPPFTYDAAFSPDGKRVLYTISRGLGLGSEMWTMDQNGRNKEHIINDPFHIIAYPRWSPTGDAIAFIRMADSNIPFTVGELVLTDGEGQNERVIAPADAGHGYPPVWSPDGKQVAFVARENAEDSNADIAAPYLESNIYLVDAASGATRAATQFEGTLTDGPTWSPDGAWLALSTDAGGIADIWLVEVASGEVQQMTQSADARYPVWVAGGE